MLVSIFQTELGWFGLSATDILETKTSDAESRISGLTIGHHSAADVRRTLLAAGHSTKTFITPDECDWNISVRKQLQRFAQGLPETFDDLPLAFPPMTEFQQSVIDATRTIRYGETVSYAELATLAGSPRAARAVGNVMAKNRFPIFIPCHRVLAAGNGWGGFSAGQGVTLKKRMLQLESQELES